MKSVRLFFTKKGNARFMSHLDLNRLMIRIIRKACIGIWYTEGFNPHPYVTFALPLPLGFEGNYEIMDIRLNDDNADIKAVMDSLNAVSPETIRFFDVAQPCLKTGNIAFAEYEIIFDDSGDAKDKLGEFLKKPSIIAKKRTKKGDFKEIDIKSKIKSFSLGNDGENTMLSLMLPAGPDDNINPSILLDAFFGDSCDAYYCFLVKRTSILDKNLNMFK